MRFAKTFVSFLCLLVALKSIFPHPLKVSLWETDGDLQPGWWRGVGRGSAKACNPLQPGGRCRYGQCLLLKDQSAQGLRLGGK